MEETIKEKVYKEVLPYEKMNKDILIVGDSNISIYILLFFWYYWIKKNVSFDRSDAVLINKVFEI